MQVDSFRPSALNNSLVKNGKSDPQQDLPFIWQSVMRKVIQQSGYSNVKLKRGLKVSNIQFGSQRSSELSDVRVQDLRAEDCPVTGNEKLHQGGFHPCGSH